jgi:hypothetical protein
MEFAEKQNCITMKTLLLKNWNIMRVLRLAIAVWLLISAFQTKEIMFGLLGGLLLIMAVMNVGCCGANGCAAPMVKRKNKLQKGDEINYEEIT